MKDKENPTPESLFKFLDIQGLACEHTRIGILGLIHEQLPSTDGALRDPKRKFTEFLITISHEQIQ